MQDFATIHRIQGFHSHGGTPIAGWFIMEHTIEKDVPLWIRNLHMGVYENGTLALVILIPLNDFSEDDDNSMDTPFRDRQPYVK